jgi:hypothetical protein
MKRSERLIGLEFSPRDDFLRSPNREGCCIDPPAGPRSPSRDIVVDMADKPQPGARSATKRKLGRNEFRSYEGPALVVVVEQEASEGTKYPRRGDLRLGLVANLTSGSIRAIERSDAGRMEDGGLFGRGVWGGLVICRDWRRCDLEHDHYAQSSPLIGAIRLRGDRRGWRANWARASKARTRHAMCRRRPFLCRFHRVARDECIESAQVQERIRLSGNKVVTTSPSGGRRAETVDQKKQKRSRPQSRQFFEPNGPHHTSATERANPFWRKPASKLVCVRRGHFESNVTLGIA